MKNEQIIWAKVLLSSYKYLGTLCKAIDRLVESAAQNSMYTSSIWSSQNSVINVSNRILKLSNKKIDYINLKLITEKALKKLPEKMAKILILKYIHQTGIDEIAEIFNCSERSIYRRCNNALINFMKNLTMFGYTAEYLHVNYSHDMYISSVYDSIKNYKSFIKEIVEVPSAEMLFNNYLHELKAI